MSALVGLTATQTKADVHQTVGGLAREFSDLMLRVKKTQEDFMLLTDLTTPPWSMAATGESDIVKSACTDMYTIYQIYVGAATQGSLKDFRSFIRQVAGIPH